MREQCPCCNSPQVVFSQNARQGNLSQCNVCMHVWDADCNTKPKEEKPVFETAIFLELVAACQKKCHDNSVKHGFWYEGKTTVKIDSCMGEQDAVIKTKPANIAEKLMLMVSEISEAMEAHRKPHPRFKINDTYWLDKDGNMSAFQTTLYTKPEGFGIELADTVIRIMDLCEYLKIDLGQAILDKMTFNESRPHKHGKEY